MASPKRHLPAICSRTILSRVSGPGKRGRVVNAVESLTAHISEIEEQTEAVPACVESALGDKDSDSTACTPATLGTKMYIPSTEIQTVDLYTVGSEEPDEFEISPLPEVPFVHGIAVNGPKGSIVRVRGVFDSGAMVNAMCSAVYDSIKHRLSPLRKSRR